MSNFIFVICKKYFQLSKSQLIAKIAQRTGHSTKDIKAVHKHQIYAQKQVFFKNFINQTFIFEKCFKVLEAHHAVGAVALAKVGEFKIHGLANLKTKKKEAKVKTIWKQVWKYFHLQNKSSVNMKNAFCC